MTNAHAARLHLTIDGRHVAVGAGTTVAAALAIAGVGGGTRTSVRGEARAALCGMGVCQECRVTIDGRAHVLACQTLCREGQVVRTTVAAGAMNANASADGSGNANANANASTVIATATAAIKGTGITTGKR